MLEAITGKRALADKDVVAHRLDPAIFWRRCLDGTITAMPCMVQKGIPCPGGQPSRTEMEEGHR